MKRLTSNEPCSFGSEVTLRMTRTVAEGLFEHMRSNPNCEQMAFALGRPSATAAGTIFLVNEVLLPDRDDLAKQSVAGICPTMAFQSEVYRAAYRSGSSIVEFHSHPGDGTPHFSGTDDFYARPNAEYITSKFPDPGTLVMVVSNRGVNKFDGIVYDRHRKRFRQVNRLEVLGRPTNVWQIQPKQPLAAAGTTDLFERQQRIPGWNQTLLELQRIAIVGAGGNSAPLLQTLVGIGAGRQGFLALADNDSVALSNLPRIPYACPSHIHCPKVSVAVQYAGQKSPATPVWAFPCRFNEKPVRDRFKMATVLFYCGDNDAGRKEVNEFAVRYNIPLIDLGCGVQVTRDKVVAGGQVRVVLPGENACLVCCRGFDPARAALAQMTDPARAQHASHGYVVGAEAEATPSVANLNGLAAMFAISAFLALVNGSEFSQWDYLNYDQFTGRTIPARTTRHPKCPLCGPEGCLSQGDPLAETGSSEAPRMHVLKRPINRPQQTDLPVAGQLSEHSPQSLSRPESSMPEVASEGPPITDRPESQPFAPTTNPGETNNA